MQRGIPALDAAIEADQAERRAGVMRLGLEDSGAVLILQLDGGHFPAVQQALGIEGDQPAIALLEHDIHIRRRGIVEADDASDLGGEIDAEGLRRLRRSVLDKLARREQRAEELLTVIARTFGVDLEHLIVADLRGDLDMGLGAHREIREVELLEVLIGVERDLTVDGDIVTDDLEILQVGRAVLVLGHVEAHLRRLSGRLGPPHAAEE
ncbi:hypothetical protein [Methyloceanibacter superfactus]|uniref:hypothetical protein n=1 Tax=Methyloceanibacter superfactus TaxID=1774969 RepID=UPI0009F37910|nr:hypothetical protein [Methyloceanibacter superfactus]